MASGARLEKGGVQHNSERDGNKGSSWEGTQEQVWVQVGAPGSVGATGVMM